MRPLRKKVWVWVVSGLVLAGVLWSLPPIRREYHKARLQTLKEKNRQLMTKGLSGMDKLRLHMLGTPVSAAGLQRSIQGHEDALVRLGFLHREAFESTGGEANEALKALRSECPWYHAQAVYGTNFVLTACPGMMERWRKRALELGWKSRGKC